MKFQYLPATPSGIDPRLPGNVVRLEYRIPASPLRLVLPLQSLLALKHQKKEKFGSRGVRPHK